MAKYQDTVETLISARNEVAGELQKAERQMKEQAARERQRSQEQEKLSRERAQVEAQIQDASLRRTGQHLQADIAQVRQSYAHRIQVAQAANQTELASRLQLLQRMKEAEVRAAHEQTRLRAQQAQQQQALTARLAVLGKVTMIGGGIVAGVGVANVLTEAMKGDFEGAAEALERMPLGIGEVARHTRTLLGELTGINAQIERSEAATERMNRLIEVQRSLYDQVRRVRQQSDDAAIAYQQERELLALEGIERRRAELRQQRENAERQIRERAAAEESKLNADRSKELQAIRKELEPLEAQRADLEAQAGTGQRLGSRNPLVQEIEELSRKADILNRQIDNASSSITASVRRDLGELNLTFAARAAALEREAAEAEQRAQVERMRAVAQADEQIVQMRLRHAGQIHEAERRAIWETHTQSVRAAVDAGDLILADKRRVIRDMAIADHDASAIRKRLMDEEAEKRRGMADAERHISDQLARMRSRAQSPSAPALDQNRFLTGVRQESEQRDRGMQSVVNRQIKIMEDQLKVLRDSLKQSEIQTQIYRDSPPLHIVRD